MKKRTLNFLIASTCFFMVSMYYSCTPKIAEEVKKPKDEMVGTGTAPQPKPTWETASIPVDESVRTGTLPNGIKYYIQKNQKPENRAELRLAVNAGAMQEDEDQQGLAHFVEHMAFNGTKHFKKNELIDYLETTGTKFGPDLNAYTSFDETVYMLQVRTDEQEMLDKGMLILQDWASGLAFNEEEIDKERGVVESEWRTGLGPSERMRQEWFPVMFKDSRYANRLPIGKPEIIKKAPYEAFKRFYKDWYRPELMAVVVVGDVDLDKMENEIKTRFSPIEKSDNPRKKVSREIPKHKETLVSVVTDKEAPFTNIQLLYKHDASENNNLKDYRNRMVRSLYNSMLNGRLGELAQKGDPPFIRAFSGYSGFVRASDAYYASAMVSETGVVKGLETLLEENARVLKHGFTATELEREKVALLERIERSFKERDKTQSRRLASKYVYNYLENSPMPSPEQSLELHKKFIPTITLQEVNQLAKKWITDENRVVVITGPEKDGVVMPTEQDVQNILAKAKMKDVAPYVDKVLDKPLLEANLKPTAIKDEKTIANLGVTELTLANGIKVVLKPTDFKNDEIQFRAFSDGGHGAYSGDDYLAAAFATTVISQSGVGEFDLISLDKMMTGKTAKVTPWISDLSEGLRGNAAPKDIETMFQLIYLNFTQPRKDEEAFKSMIQKMKIQGANILSLPQYYFIDRRLKKTFKNSPRKKIFPTPEELDRISHDKIMEIYKDRFADASDFTFIFVGNFDVAKFKPLLNKYLGNLPATNRNEKWTDPNVESFKGALVDEFSKGEAPKSQVHLDFRGAFDWDDTKARQDFRSLIALLRIKMRESMREDKGGVYGVRVSGNVSRYPKEGYNVAVSFNCDPGREQELIDAALNDIKTVKTNGAEELDLTKVKETQKQERKKQLKENGFWSGYLNSVYKNDLDINRIQYEVYEKEVDAVDSASLKAMANKIFDMKNHAKFIMTPEKKE